MLTKRAREYDSTLKLDARTPSTPLYGETPRSGAARADGRWLTVCIGFGVYCCAHTAGALMHYAHANDVGFLLMATIIIATNPTEALSFRRDRSVVLSAAIIAVSVFSTLVGHEHVEPRFLVKHCVIFLLYIILFNLRLGPISETPRRRIVAAFLAAIAAVSVLFPNVESATEITRVAGVFANPNNLALTVAALLFTLSHEKDSVRYRVTVHGIVLALVMMTATTGATLAYGCAVLYMYAVGTGNRHRRASLRVAGGAATVAALAWLLIWGAGSLGRGLLLREKVAGQYELMSNEGDFALSGGTPNFSDLGQRYGKSSLSGLWRLYHWRKLWDQLGDATYFQLAAGFGVGTSAQLLDLLPHNDYLRMLLEQGAVGLGLTLWFFLLAAVRIPRAYRFGLVFLASFGACANVVDNLLFMSVVVVFLASMQQCNSMRALSQVAELTPRRASPHNTPKWAKRSMPDA